MIKPRTAQFWSAVTLFFFLGHTAAWSLPAEPISFSPKTELPKAFTQINIPETLAQVDEIYEAPAKVDPKLVFHIQNMHGNYEAQLQVRKLLQYLYDQYGFKTIFVEGAAERLEPEYLSVFPDKERNFRLADSLAKKGQLTGPEFFLADGPKDVEAIGIEDAALYHDNFMAFRKVHANKSHTSNFFTAFDNQIEKISSHILTSDTRRVLSEWKKFEKGHRDFLPFVRQLAQEAKTFTGLDLESLFSQVEWPQISRLLVIQAMEKELNRELAENEKKQVIAHLQKLNVSPEIVSAIENLETSRVTVARKGGVDNQLENLPRYLFERLVDEATPKGFKFHEYPAFSLWAGYTILKSELDARSLFEEINRIFEKVLNELAATDSQKNLLELYRDRHTLQKLFDLELTRKEWNQALYRKDWIVPERMVSRLEKLSQEASEKAASPNNLAWEIDLKTLSSLSPQPILLPKGEGTAVKNELATRSSYLSPQGEGMKVKKSLITPSRLGRGLGEGRQDSKILQEIFETGFEFYRLARQREDAFYQKIEKEMSERKVEKAVLVTGGFHTDGIAEKFREHEVNYSTLMPRVRSEDYSQKSYQAVMLETEPAHFDLSTLEQPNYQNPLIVEAMTTSSFAQKHIERLLAGFLGVQKESKRPATETVSIWGNTPYAKSGFAVLSHSGNKFAIATNVSRAEVRTVLTDQARAVAMDLHRSLPLNFKFHLLKPKVLAEWFIKKDILIASVPKNYPNDPFDDSHHQVVYSILSNLYGNGAGAKNINPFLKWLGVEANAKAFVDQLIEWSSARQNLDSQYLSQLKTKLGDLTSFRNGLASAKDLTEEARNARIYYRVLDSIKEAFPTATLNQINAGLVVLLGFPIDQLSFLGMSAPNQYLISTLSVLAAEIPVDFRESFARYLYQRSYALEGYSISGETVEDIEFKSNRAFNAYFSGAKTAPTSTNPMFAVEIVQELLYELKEHSPRFSKYALYEIYETMPVDSIPLNEITKADVPYRLLSEMLIHEIARQLAPQNINMNTFDEDIIEELLNKRGLPLPAEIKDAFFSLFKKIYPLEVERYQKYVVRPFQDAIAKAAVDSKDANRAAKLYAAIIAYLSASAPALSFDDVNGELGSFLRLVLQGGGAIGSLDFYRPLLVELKKLADKSDIVRILQIADSEQLYANFWSKKLDLKGAERNTFEASLAMIKQLDAEGKKQESAKKAESLLIETSKIQDADLRRAVLGEILAVVPAAALAPNSYRVVVLQTKIPAGPLDKKFDFKELGIHSLAQIMWYLSGEERFELGYKLLIKIDKERRVALFNQLPKATRDKIVAYQNELRTVPKTEVPVNPPVPPPAVVEKVVLSPSEQTLADAMRSLKFNSDKRIHSFYSDFQIKVYYELMNYFARLAVEVPALKDMNIQQVHTVIDRLDKALLWGNDKIVLVPLYDRDGKTDFRVPVGALLEKRELIFKDAEGTVFNPFEVVRPITQNSLRYFDFLRAPENPSQTSANFTLLARRASTDDVSVLTTTRRVGLALASREQYPLKALDALIDAKQPNFEESAVTVYLASKLPLSVFVEEQASKDRFRSVLRLLIDKVHSQGNKLFQPISLTVPESVEAANVTVSGIIFKLKLGTGALTTHKLGGYYSGVILYQALGADEKAIVRNTLTVDEVARLDEVLEGWKRSIALASSWFSWSWLFGSPDAWWESLFVNARKSFTPVKLQDAYRKEFVKTNQMLTEEQILTMESQRREIVRAGHNSAFILFPAEAQNPLAVYKNTATAFGEAPEILQLTETPLYFHVYPRDIFGDRGVKPIPSNQILVIVPSQKHKETLLKKSPELSGKVENHVYTYGEFIALLPTFSRSEVRQNVSSVDSPERVNTLDLVKIPENLRSVPFGPGLKTADAEIADILKLALPWGIAEQSAGPEVILPYAKFITASPYDSQLQNVRAEYPGVESDAPGALVFYTAKAPGLNDLKAYRSLLMSRKNQYLRVALPRGVFADKGQQFQYEMMVQSIYGGFAKEIGKRFEVVYDVAPNTGLRRLETRLFNQIKSDGISIKPENIVQWNDSSVAQISGYQNEVLDMALLPKAKLVQSGLLKNASDSDFYGSFTVVGVLEGLMLAETPADSTKLAGETLSQKDYQALQSEGDGFFRFVVSDSLRGYAARLQQALAIDLAISSAA